MTATINYEPKGAVRQLFLCRDPEVLVEGPAGTGKSRGLLEKAVLCQLKYPRSRVLITRKTRASMTESVLVTLEERVFPEAAGSIFPDIRNQQRKTRTHYDFGNGSTIVIGGMDNPMRIMSTEYDMILAFEATELTETDHEQLLTRLRNGRMPYQQIVCDVNPGATSHWLNRRAAAGRMTRFLSRHQDNPTLWDGEKWTERGERYIEVLNRLTGVRRTRLLEGKWATAEGAVYADFDPLIHIVDEVKVGENWRRFRSIDFGYTNPFTCQWWAVDPDGRMYLYRELYATGRLVEDWAKDIIRHSEGEKIEATVSDHDAEDRATLQRHGIHTIAAHKAVSTGIQAVEKRLRPAGDGKPRLFVKRSCLVSQDRALVDSHRPLSVLGEFEAYVYPKGFDGRSLKEEPVKEHDHGMDALRYAVCYADKLGAKEVGVRVMGGRSIGVPEWR